MKNLKSKKVLIIDNNFVTSLGLKYILETELNCIVYISNEIEYIKNYLKNYSLDLIIVDIFNQKQINSDLFKIILTFSNSLKVLFYSDFNEKQITSKLRKKNFYTLNKNSSINKFFKKISQLLFQNQNDIFFKKKSEKPIQLSKREEEIIYLLLNGFHNKDVCQKLNLSPTTVSTYKKRIFEKYQIKNLLELKDYIIT